MSHLWASAVPLLSAALILRVLLGCPSKVRGWDWRIEIPRALFVGVFFAIISAWWMSPIHAGIDPQIKGIDMVSSITADFQDYCGAIGMYGQNVFDGAWPSKRSRGAAFVAGELSRWFSVLDSLSIAAIIGTGFVGSGLYIWGRVLGGVLAGLGTVLLGLTMGPLPLLSRMLTFYPSITAAMVMGAALTAGALCYRSRGWLLAAGFGISACLLTDVRGLVWALPFFCVLLVSLLIRPLERVPGWRRWVPMGCLMAPLFVAWPLGSWSYPSHADSLEEQADVRDLFELHGAESDEFVGQNDLPSEYVWGRSNLLEIPETLGFLMDQTEMEPQEELGLCVDEEIEDSISCRTDSDCPGTTRGTARCEGYVSTMRDPSPGAHEAHVHPWIPIWLLLGALSVLGLLWRRRLRTLEAWVPFVALVVSLVPFLVALQGIVTIREMQVRFLTQVMPAMALLMGLGFATVLRWPSSDDTDGWLVRRWPRLKSTASFESARTLVPLAVLGLLVSGFVPSWWGPRSEWRTYWVPNGEVDTHHATTLAERGGFTEGVRMYCFRALEADREAGWTGGLIGFEESTVDSLDVETVRRGGHMRGASGPDNLGTSDR